MKSALNASDRQTPRICGVHLVGGELLKVFVKAFQACVGLLHLIVHPGSLLSFLLPLTLQLQRTDDLCKH